MTHRLWVDRQGYFWTKKVWDRHRALRRQGLLTETRKEPAEADLQRWRQCGWETPFEIVAKTTDDEDGGTPRARIPERSDASSRPKEREQNLHRRRQSRSQEDRQLMLTTHNLGTQNPTSLNFEQQETMEASKMRGNGLEKLIQCGDKQVWPPRCRNSPRTSTMDEHTHGEAAAERSKTIQAGGNKHEAQGRSQQAEALAQDMRAELEKAIRREIAMSEVDGPMNEKYKHIPESDLFATPDSHDAEDAPPSTSFARRSRQTRPDDSVLAGNRKSPNQLRLRHAPATRTCTEGERGALRGREESGDRRGSTAVGRTTPCRRPMRRRHEGRRCGTDQRRGQPSGTGARRRR